MAKPDQEGQPAQVPGDAESPGKDKADRTIKEGIRHTDETEPVQSAEKAADRKPA